MESDPTATSFPATLSVCLRSRLAGTGLPRRWILGVMFARDDEATLGIVVEIGVVFGDEV